MMRHESNTGQLHDLSHATSEYCLADPLTKDSVKPDQLIKSIETGTLEAVDTRPPFRTLVKHKINNCREPNRIVSFFAEDVAEEVYTVFYGRQDCLRTEAIIAQTASRARAFRPPGRLSLSVALLTRRVNLHSRRSGRSMSEWRLIQRHSTPLAGVSAEIAPDTTDAAPAPLEIPAGGWSAGVLYDTGNSEESSPDLLPDDDHLHRYQIQILHQSQIIWQSKQRPVLQYAATKYRATAE